MYDTKGDTESPDKLLQFIRMSKTLLSIHRIGLLVRLMYDTHTLIYHPKRACENSLFQLIIYIYSKVVLDS